MDKVMVENTLQLETIRLKREGRAESKKEDIIELLEDCGEVTETLKKAVDD
jgi:hypothetical protein